MTKKILLLFVAASIFASAMALNHGSMSMTNVQMYSQGDNGPNMTDPVSGLTMSFKLVTIGNTTWTWTDLQGADIMGDTYSSQLRWWQPDKVENNLLGRIAGTQQTFGKVTSLPTINPVQITFMQQTSGGEWLFRESPFFTYDYTLQNTPVAGDVTAPVLADPVIVSQSATQLVLSLAATDDNDVFYYITDAANGFEEVFFTNQVTIALAQDVDYNFTITAIDFSGNESASKNISINSISFLCNNTLDGVGMHLGSADDLWVSAVDGTTKDGAPYFAPGWNPSTDYTATVSGNNFELHFGSATFENWQAQFRIFLDQLLPLSDDTYSIVMNVEVSANTAFYVKFFDNNDNIFMELPRQTVNSGSVVELSAYDYVRPSGLTQIRQILFDFGPSPANLDIDITDIALCSSAPTSVDNQNNTRFSVFPNPAERNVTISGLSAPAMVTITDLMGKTVLQTQTSGNIDISNLNSGLYLLNIENQIFKIIKK